MEIYFNRLSEKVLRLNKMEIDTEINEIIHEFFGDNVSEQDTQIFLKYIANILRKETENLIFNYRKSNIPFQKTMATNNFSNQINLFLCPSQFNNFYQNCQYLQNPLMQSYQNSCAYPQNQFYAQIQNPQQPTNSNFVPEDPKKRTTKHSHKKSKSKEKKSKKLKDDKVKEFKNIHKDQLDGICNYLTQKTGGNIHQNRTINITSNNINNTMNYVDYINKFNGDSSSAGGTYICFDFKQYKVQLKSYSILSFSNPFGSSQPKNWVIEVSNNNQDWIEIDRHQNDSTLNKSNVVGSFEIQRKDKNFYQYIRIRQTGEGWKGNGFGFNAIEFYGFLKEF